MSVAIRPICLTFVLGLSACGAPAPGDICQRYAEECGDTSDECVSDLGDLEADATAAGCDAELDDYLGCLDGLESLCDGAVQAGCAGEGITLADCIAAATPQGAP